MEGPQGSAFHAVRKNMNCKSDSMPVTVQWPASAQAHWPFGRMAAASRWFPCPYCTERWRCPLATFDNHDSSPDRMRKLILGTSINLGTWYIPVQTACRMRRLNMPLRFHFLSCSHQGHYSYLRQEGATRFLRGLCRISRVQVLK